MEKQAERERKAAGVEPGLRERNLRRLRRIEGQVRGIAAMVEAGRYCPDIIAQVAAAQAALRAVSRELMRNHLGHCVREAAAEGGAKADATYKELLDVIYKHLR